jgi:tetratricopeptide (TPR) repeat protein
MYLAASFSQRRRADRTPMASSARIDELRKKFEENPRRYFAPLANEYRKAGDIEQAISICKEYLPQQPGHMSGHIVYGQALYEARQYEEARTVFETALALDPENLIALRHLGDIALIVGDIDGARGWYGRVLEADPRNEEIQAQLKSLESVGPAAAPTPMSTSVVESSPPAPAAAEPAAAETIPQASEPAQLPALELTTPAEPPQPAATPASSAPTIVAPAMPLPTIERTVEIPATPTSAVQSLSTTPTAEITLDKVPVPAVPDLEKAAEAPGPGLPVEKAAGFEPTADSGSERGAVAPTAGLETSTPPAAHAPPIDSFTLDGLETTSMSPAAPVEVPPPPAAEASSPDPGPAAAAPVPLDPIPAAQAAPESAAESTAEAPAVAEPSVVMPTPVVPPPVIAETETTATGTEPGSPPAEAPTSSSELMFLDVGHTSPEQMEAVSAHPAEPPSPAPAPLTPPNPVAESAAEPVMAESKPFVTETMAELYEQQGHRDEALRVYRALLEQRPTDAHVRSRIEQLEGKRGPTIRELLSRVAARRPAPQSVPQSAPSAMPAPVPVEPVAPPAPAPRNDLLGQLFGGASVAGADENAAITLSAAFSNDGRANGSGGSFGQLAGTAAHPAPKDLSLDAVFGSQSVAPPASSFSFDQFFSERATAEHPAPAARGATEGQETKDDVAKFTQWLEGLKQR